MITNRRNTDNRGWRPRQRATGEQVTEAPEDLAPVLGRLILSPTSSIRGGSAPQRTIVDWGASQASVPPLRTWAIHHPSQALQNASTLSVHQPLQQPQSQPGSLEGSEEKISVIQRNEKIRSKVIKDISPRARSPIGWIYAFRISGCAPSAPIKIGHTGKDDVQERLQEIARACKFNPDMLFAYPVPDSPRYEALVHAMLSLHRRRETAGCVGCGKKHVEWFDVGEEEARRVVRLWAFFAALEPYDQNGVLKEEWRNKISSEKMDYEDARCWETFVYGDHMDIMVRDACRRRMVRRALALPGIVEG